MIDDLNNKMRRRSNSQPSLAVRAVHDREALEAYATRDLLRKKAEEEKATLRARNIERELQQRRSASHSFSTARPLSTSEEEAFRLQELHQRRASRLEQVRAKERVNAVLRRHSFEESRRAAAQKVATDLELDYLEGKKTGRNGFSRPNSTPQIVRHRRSSIINGGGNLGDNDSARHRRLSVNSGEGEDSHFIRSVVADDDDDAAADDDDEDQKPLWELYHDLERQQKQWAEARDRLQQRAHLLEKSSSSSSRKESLPVKGQSKTLREDDGGRSSSSKFEFLNENASRERPIREKYVARELKREQQQHEDPRVEVVQRRNQPSSSSSGSRYHTFDDDDDDIPPVDLKPDDVIVLKDDGVFLESLSSTRNGGDRLASTTWFAMAEERLSNSSDSSSSVPSNGSFTEVKSNLRSASRLLLESPPDNERKLDDFARSSSSYQLKEKGPVLLRPSEKRAATLERLRRGEKPKLDRREIYERTERSFIKLPEISELRKEILKREDFDRRRRMVQEMDLKRRSSLHINGKSS